jgi:hypothetical protein
MNLIDPDELLLSSGAARYLGVSDRRIYALRKEGSIGRKIAGVWMYTKTELDHYRATRRGKNGRPRKKEVNNDQTSDHGQNEERRGTVNNESEEDNTSEG